MARVAALMGEWAEGLGLDDNDLIRWRAAGLLHDALRDAPAESMVPWVPDRFRNLPVSFLHGPAAAARLEAEGVKDEDVLAAIRYHTLGNGGLAPIGRALISADYLEPGRRAKADWRARQRERMPEELNAVLKEVVRSKLDTGLSRDLPLRPELVELWNVLAAS